MKENTQLPIKAAEQRLALAKRVDEIACGAMELFKEAGSFESELQVAVAMRDLELALTDEMMVPVMSLMNSDLGFRTDRDPAISPKDKEGNPMTPYAVPVVRRCFIESKLRGFHAVGNEWNIIAGRFYACRNGLKRKCEQWKGVTDLKVDLGVPKAAGDKGAIVPVTARWFKDRVADSIAAEIPVRVNFGMGADAILGKAERKIYKRIHDRLSGITTPDGEAGEDLEVLASATATASPAPRFDKSKSIPVEEVPKPEAKAEQPADAPAETKPEPKTETPQQILAGIVTGAGHTWDDFAAWGKQSGNFDPAGYGGFAELSHGAAVRFIGAKNGLLRGLSALKKS
jgi:hypothetical protein